MKDIFLADAHLSTPDQENYQALLDFLDSFNGQVRTLYLLGDIFEFWSNFNQLPASYEPLVRKLENLAISGCRITWVEGNHDFHLKRYFSRQSGFDVLPDGGPVTLDGKKVFIAHGDLVDPLNRSYLRLRRILRSPFIAFLTGILPLSLLEGIAKKMSAESKKRRRRYQKKEELVPLLEAHATDKFNDGAVAVVTGHYHTPIFKKLDDGLMIALGDWIHDYSYAEHEDGQFTLKAFTPS